MPESGLHNRIKHHVYKKIARANIHRKGKIEHKINNRIADIYFELPNQKKVVIEIQLERMTQKQCIERTKDYNQANCYVLWLINKAFNKGNELCNTSKIERYLHRLYMGRVYHSDWQGNIFPLSFKGYSYIYYNEYMEKYYTRWLKRTKYFKMGKIPNYILLCTKNDWEDLLIARFYDKKLEFN